MKLIKDEFLQANKVLQEFISNEKNFTDIEAAGSLMAAAFKGGNKIFSCGNGGSMCDAMHFAEELSGRFRNNRPALPAVAISDASYISCVANDFGYDQVFARYLEAFGSKGDVLLAISTSGNSKNVVEAIHFARKTGMKIVGLTGKDGGIISAMCDIEIRAPFSEFADRAQEIHIKVIHSLILFIENKLYGK
jgi:D-sedoheptulose 7-phosphate isomerase